MLLFCCHFHQSTGTNVTDKFKRFYRVMTGTKESTKTTFALHNFDSLLHINPATVRFALSFRQTWGDQYPSYLGSLRCHSHESSRFSDTDMLWEGWTRQNIGLCQDYKHCFPPLLKKAQLRTVSASNRVEKESWTLTFRENWPALGFHFIRNCIHWFLVSSFTPLLFSLIGSGTRNEKGPSQIESYILTHGDAHSCNCRQSHLLFYFPLPD